MDHFDNPSTRRVFANAEHPAEPSPSSEECLSEAPSPGPDAAASTPVEVSATTTPPALENSIQSLDDPGDHPIDDARLEKIANLKKAVDDGSYNVSAEELARKLIEYMREP
jgi:anti-sigma28 factor (negative regulator of flagellin synthesis)